VEPGNKVAEPVNEVAGPGNEATQADYTGISEVMVLINENHS
jgi:hypothetical protein